MSRSVVDLGILNTWNGELLRQLDLLPGLARAKCPVLGLDGEDDRVTPIEDQLDIAAALPSRWVEFHAFAGAGHGVWRDRPDEAFCLLRRFIAEGTAG